MKTEKQIQAEFKKRIHNRRDGFVAAQERICAEIRAEKRRERFVLTFIPRPLRAAAALFIIGLGIYFLLSIKTSDLPLCPHSAKRNFPAEAESYIADKKYDISLPERHDRICHCKPRYSGSLR